MPKPFLYFASIFLDAFLKALGNGLGQEAAKTVSLVFPHPVP